MGEVAGLIETWLPPRSPVSPPSEAAAAGGPPRLQVPLDVSVHLGRVMVSAVLPPGSGAQAVRRLAVAQHEVSSVDVSLTHS